MPIFDPRLNSDLLLTLKGLIANWENEVSEFKKAEKDYDQDKIGKYFSALSNEANLKGLQHGWLVFGVDNKSHEIVGSNYRNTQGLETLKYEISQNTTGGITFTDIFEVFDGDMRVVMFKVPAAVTAIPTAWKNIWYGRNGESLGPLSMEELDRIRGQSRRDWSRQLIDGSGIEHLDAEAIRVARDNFKIKQNREHIRAEIDGMTDEQFLTKLKLVVEGKLTNAAMVLLGNPDHDRLLEPPARFMWRLYGEDNMVKDYEEFDIPFITVVDKVYAKIRNLTYRYMPNQKTLFPIETQQYDASLLRELLNNCIAHQDYTIGSRVYLDEYEDTVVITNPGTFLPGDVREVLKPGYTAPYYRNQLLADAMVKLNMIDTVQMGIRKVFNIQRKRYFPLPDYELGNPQRVAVKVYGKILDENYTRLLYGHDDLTIETVLLLDRIQKKFPLEKPQYQRLRKAGLIEGKIPNVYVSAKVAVIVDEKEQYIKNKAMNDDYYANLILAYLQQFESGTKADFMKLLADKLSDTLDDKQKDNKVRYFLATLRRKGIIERSSPNRRTGTWRLAKPRGEE
jgi:ATP-dependent DNA helicase RecG